MTYNSNRQWPRSLQPQPSEDSVMRVNQDDGFATSYFSNASRQDLIDRAVRAVLKRGQILSLCVAIRAEFRRLCETNQN